jgi:uncharacterized protein YkwD
MFMAVFGNSLALNRYRFVSLCFLFLVVIGLGARVAAQTLALDSEEQLMLRLVNEYRAQKGLRQLRASIALTRAAEWLGVDMSSKNYFSHTDSRGRDPFARMAAFGYDYPTAKGENIAAGNNDAVRTFNQWKNSAGHNATMLNPNFSVIGIARVNNPNSRYRSYWTNDFGGYVDATLSGVSQNVRTVRAANFLRSGMAASQRHGRRARDDWRRGGGSGIPRRSFAAGRIASLDFPCG